MRASLLGLRMLAAMGAAAERRPIVTSRETWEAGPGAPRPDDRPPFPYQSEHQMRTRTTAESVRRLEAAAAKRERRRQRNLKLSAAAAARATAREAVSE